MRTLILALLFAIFIALPAFAATRTVQVVNATGLVMAIVNGPVTAPAPSGMTFLVITNDATQVQAGWIYNFTTKTFSPPPG